MTEPTTGTRLRRQSGRSALTAHQLGTWLLTQPDIPVVMSKDAEGNGFSPLSSADHGMYLAETTWSGEMYPTPEEIADDDQLTEGDSAPGDAVRAIVLWPIN